MYLCVVTMSTVGYGDLVPNSVMAKLLACVFVFTGMALVGLILGKAADYIVAGGILLVVLFVIGIVFLCVVEELEVLDAIYCVCSTITTLGYGDKSFSTAAGRSFAVFWIITSTMCLAQFYLYLAELYTEKKQRSLVRWVLTRRLTPSDLEEVDLDHDKVVSASEFVIYKLKEMGKISQEDVSLIMETFKKLDIDHSGTLTASDILLLTPRQTDE
ncbi:hypothetical protein ACLB2K_033336 [Fragaria x ananassa]